MEVVETDYVPWRTYYWHFEKLAAMLEHKPLFGNIRVNKKKAFIFK